MTTPKRTAMGTGVTASATASATLLLFAFVPGLDVQPAGTEGMPGPVKRTAPQFYRLGRS